uniref:Disintegrin domain-containing protein n=1 Tax=Fundulus heteroclitus TaxID=8078 RepID=A0A3Q2PG71_FUNHE
CISPTSQYRPVCGNAFLEPGEECDCGTVEECKNPCCNATTCQLNAGAQCAEGECCHKCQPTGSICRPRAGDCDLAEYCTGLSAACPADAFTQNGRLCNRGRGYCYNGQDQSCGKLFLITCNEATMNPVDNYPSNLGMVPTGTKCGNNMVRQ